tara:strand:+ start:86045 stop:87139 length:1095 start_codon:yes stop_codon:yes gene_type:complete
MKNLVEAHGDRLHKKKNVVAVATGKKWVDGKPTDEDALIVLVSEKVPKSQLKPSDIIEDEIEGVKTDVVGRVGKISAHPYTSKERPAAPGISCGHLWVTAGTIGGVFRDREGDLVILSNNHVLAAENRGSRGHMAIQPGRYDGGGTRDRIGLLKYFRPLINARQRTWDAANWHRIYGYNVEDSAIAVIDNENLVEEAIKDIGSIVAFNDNPTMSMAVQKTGRTTGHTTGNIIGLNATVWVDYGIGTLKFQDQIITGVMSQGGDSGSLLMDMNRNAVGLLFAGSNSVTIHNPIKYPRATYGLEIVDTVNVTEELTFVVKDNDVVQVNSYSGVDAARTAVTAALAKARETGNVQEVVITYVATPEA